MKQHWPKKIIEWHEGRVGYLSIPFTWLLSKARYRIRRGDFITDRWIVGGPAVKLMPDYLLEPASVGDDMPGILQRVNPLATRTTVGCIRRCAFCGVRRFEPHFGELSDWPDQPVICDNNLLAASDKHFDRVIDRLVVHGWADFNQGLDARLLTTRHAERLAEIRRPIVRLALDNDSDREPWADAVERCRTAGIAKSRIRSYVLCGFSGSPKEDRDRCEYVESFGIMALPMWFHPLDAMEFNATTERQKELGWTHRKRRELMCWFYQHRTLGVRG